MLSSNPTVPSCKKCFGIVQNLNDHIINDHSASVHSSHIAYLNNIILNLLSLITHSSDCETDKDKSEQATSSPSKIREFNNIVTNSVALEVDSSQTVPTSVISKNSKVDSESSFKQKQKQKEEEFLKSYHAQGGLNISGPSELTPKMAFQQDIINEFLTESLDNDQYVDAFKKNRPKTSKQNKLEQVDLSQLIGTPTDDTVSTALLTPDGNLTPAGLSLLLANQQKNINSSGKSDLDVADILVNKMPIPSLNKGLDPNLLHLSQLYLQQWALNQQTQALVDANSSNITSSNPLKIEKQNSQPELKQKSLPQHQPKPQQQVHQLQPQQQPQLSQKQQTQLQKLQNKYMFSESPSVNDPNSISLQQLIAQHKKISGQIESLNSKEKKAPEETEKNSSSQPSQTNYVFDPLSQSFVGENSIIAMSPTQQHSSLEQLNNNQSSLPVSLMPVTQVVYSKPLEKHITNSKETSITNLDDIEQKNDNNISGSSNNNGNNDSNKVSVYLDGETVNEDNIEFVRNEVIPLVNSNPHKTALYALQSLVIQGTVQNGNEEKPDNSNGTDANRKRNFSAITMVPVSQYDTLTTDSDSVTHPKESKILHNCNICGVTFTVLSTLEAHMKTHGNEKIEECMYCHQSFSDNDEYFKHIASHCGEENIIRCPHCPKIFTSKGDYTKHVTSHTQNRPYQCSHCKKSFKDPGSLTKHERIHTGEQPYVCEICSRGFAEKSSLCKHMRTHSGEKPYKCDQCDKSFSISGNLHRHLFIHTGQRPFKCTICSKAFNNASHLKRHIKNIHQKESSKNIPELGNGGLVIPRQNESHLIAVSTHNVITAISEI